MKGVLFVCFYRHQLKVYCFLENFAKLRILFHSVLSLGMEEKKTIVDFEC